MRNPAKRFEMGALAAEAVREHGQGRHKVLITCAGAGSSRADAPMAEPAGLHGEGLAHGGGR